MPLAAILTLVGQFLIGLFIKRLIVALGIGVVTYVGMKEALDWLKQHFYSAYFTLPADLLALLDIGGFKHGISIIFGALAFRVSMYAWSKFEMGVLG